MLKKTTFGKLYDGEEFHFAEIHGPAGTNDTFVKVSARKYGRKGLTLSWSIDTAKREVWSTGKHS